jgi:autotransporter-associated beta strand protein
MNLRTSTPASAVILLLAALSGAGLAQAGNYVWDGTANNWHTPHWGGTVPAAGNTYTIASGIATDSTTAVFVGDDLEIAAGGTLFHPDAGTAIAGGSVTLNGGTLETPGASGGLRALVASNGFVVADGSVSTVSVVNANASYAFGLNGVLSGSGTLVKEGAGTLTLLTSSPAFTGTIDLCAGELWIKTNIPNAYVNILAGGQLSVTSSGVTSNRHLVANGGSIYFQAGTAQSLAGNLDVAGDSYVAGDASNARSLSGLTLSGSGNLIFTNNFGLTLLNSVVSTGYTGVVVFAASGSKIGVQGSTLMVGGLSSTNGVGTITKSTTGSQLVILRPGAGQAYDFSGNITNSSGTLGVQIAGSGMQTLSGGGNGYNGDTTVSNGTLLLDGVLLAGAAVVSVTNGGTLGGTGEIRRAVFVQSGSTLAPGSASANVGSLTVSNLTLRNDSTYAWEWNGTTGDCVAVQNNLVLGTAANTYTCRLARSGSVSGRPAGTFPLVTGARNVLGTNGTWVIDCRAANWPGAYVTTNSTGLMLCFSNYVAPGTVVQFR